MEMILLDNPYHRIHNPDGVIQLGLAQNTLCVDLIQEWIRHTRSAAILETQSNCGCLSITDLATYHGFMDFEVVGAISAIEILSFCLADNGNAFQIIVNFLSSKFLSMLSALLQQAFDEAISELDTLSEE
ncbi:hypothetical protein TSUD_297620 [Trifolium subterraneum]|uniref:Uncharacterized protein n=1 Tax=Trifolium subterraneum TaxID=3900 RepID=A0A2Z6LPN4_TRISU|nr:hypothetical protein TSUD_297620 [Trifolium subterraneum]